MATFFICVDFEFKRQAEITFSERQKINYRVASVCELTKRVAFRRQAIELVEIGYLCWLVVCTAAVENSLLTGQLTHALHELIEIDLSRIERIQRLNKQVQFLIYKKKNISLKSIYVVFVLDYLPLPR